MGHQRQFCILSWRKIYESSVFKLHLLHERFKAAVRFRSKLPRLFFRLILQHPHWSFWFLCINFPAWMRFLLQYPCASFSSSSLNFPSDLFRPCFPGKSSAILFLILVEGTVLIHQLKKLSLHFIIIWSLDFFCNWS